MTTTTNTNRLDGIVQRERGGRARDLAFAILIALLMVLQVSALRSAARTTTMSDPTAQHAAPVQMEAGTAAACAVGPVC